MHVTHQYIFVSLKRCNIYVALKVQKSQQKPILSVNKIHVNAHKKKKNYESKSSWFSVNKNFI